MKLRIVLVLLLGALLGGCTPRRGGTVGGGDADEGHAALAQRRGGAAPGNRASATASAMTAGPLGGGPLLALLVVAVALGWTHRRRAQAERAVDSRGPLRNGPQTIAGVVEPDAGALRPSVVVYVHQHGAEMNGKGLTQSSRDQPRCGRAPLPPPAGRRPPHPRRAGRPRPGPGAARHRPAPHPGLPHPPGRGIRAGTRVQITGEPMGGGRPGAGVIEPRLPRRAKPRSSCPRAPAPWSSAPSPPARPRPAGPASTPAGGGPDGGARLPRRRGRPRLPGARRRRRSPRGRADRHAPLGGVRQAEEPLGLLGLALRRARPRRRRIRHRRGRVRPGRLPVRPVGRLRSSSFRGLRTLPRGSIRLAACRSCPRGSSPSSSCRPWCWSSPTRRARSGRGPGTQSPASATPGAAASIRPEVSPRGCARVLAHSGTTILKFFLHISKEEQLARFAQRLMTRGATGRSVKPTIRSVHLGRLLDALRTRSARPAPANAPWYTIPESQVVPHLAVSKIIADTISRVSASASRRRRSTSRTSGASTMRPSRPARAERSGKVARRAEGSSLRLDSPGKRELAFDPFWTAQTKHSMPDRSPGPASLGFVVTKAWGPTTSAPTRARQSRARHGKADVQDHSHQAVAL